MHRSTRTVPVLLLVAGLCACGSSPPVRYFSLEPIETEYRRDPPDAPLLGLGPLRMPDYLDRPQMVSRSAGAEMLVDDVNRWAEPLDHAVHRTLATNVDYLLDTVIAIAFPYTAAGGMDYRLIGRLDRFDVDEAGRAVLVVQWRVEDADGGVVIAPRRDRYEAGVARRGDPGASAAALNDTLAQFSRDIATAIEAVLK